MDITQNVSVGFKAEIDAFIEAQRTSQRDRIWTRQKMFWSMVVQAFDFNATCASAIKRLQAAGFKCSSNTAGFCKARAKFPEKLLDQILTLTAGFTSPNTRLGKRILHIDGVAFTLNDTAENHAKYDTPSGQKEGCGFPVMSALAIRSAITGVFLAIFPGNWKVHDLRLFINSISFFQADDIVVADRAFCAYTSFAWMRLIGADMVCRLHQRRKFDPSKEKKNGKNDWTVVWKKGVHSAKSPIPADQFEKFPDEMSVRIVQGKEECKGFRTKNILVATTLLDVSLYPADLILDIYLERWEIETSFGDLKDSMRYDFIRSRSPASVIKTLKAMLIAHNLIRAMCGTAACKHRVRWKRISFKGAATSIRFFLAHRLVGGLKLGIANFQRLLAAIASDIVPERPNRREPRAVKKRAKPYPLLTCKRSLYQEIPHKSRYRKSEKSA